MGMLIDISDILKENGLSKEAGLSVVAADIGVQDQECEFEDPMTVTAEFTNINGMIRAKGHVTVSYTVCCARCLKPIRRVVDRDIEEEVVRSDLLTAAEDYYWYTGKELDFGPIVRDAILLDMPVRHLCSADCKALCPICGKDLNEGDCSCEAESGGSPFDVLRGFVPEEKPGN